jgi:hypothetical protein
MDKVHKRSDSDCYTPSSEPFRFCWIHAALDRDQWQNFVNTMMTIVFLEIQGTSCVAKLLLGSQERFCSARLVG